MLRSSYCSGSWQSSIFFRQAIQMIANTFSRNRISTIPRLTVPENGKRNKGRALNCNEVNSSNQANDQESVEWKKSCQFSSIYKDLAIIQWSWHKRAVLGFLWISNKWLQDRFFFHPRSSFITQWWKKKSRYFYEKESSLTATKKKVFSFKHALQSILVPNGQKYGRKIEPKTLITFKVGGGVGAGTLRTRVATASSSSSSSSAGAAWSVVADHSVAGAVQRGPLMRRRHADLRPPRAAALLLKVFRFQHGARISAKKHTHNPNFHFKNPFFFIFAKPVVSLASLEPWPLLQTLVSTILNEEPSWSRRLAK